MRTVPLLRPVLTALCLGAVLVAAPACKKSSSEVTVEAPPAEAPAENAESSPEAIVEENENGSVAWSIAPDGQVKALVKSTDGKPITQNITGQLLWQAPNGDQKIPITIDPKTHLVVATGPKLEADLTEITYSLQVQNKPWLGTLHVPRGGTLELRESANVAVTVPVPAGKVGPNGGVIQTVGQDRVEVVADKTSGQVRVYFLDPEFKVIKGPERKVKIALAGDTSEIVVLEPEPAGSMFFVGRMKSRVDPVRLTVAVTERDVTHACIVGWHPHTHLVVGPQAPRVRLLVASGWEPAEVHVRASAPGAVVVREVEDRGRVRVKVREDAHAVAGAGVSVGVGVRVALPKPPPPPSIRVGIGVSAGASVGAHAGAGVHVKGRH